MATKFGLGAESSRLPACLSVCLSVCLLLLLLDRDRVTNHTYGVCVGLHRSLDKVSTSSPVFLPLLSAECITATVCCQDPRGSRTGNIHPCNIPCCELATDKLQRVLNAAALHVVSLPTLGSMIEANWPTRECMSYWHRQTSMKWTHPVPDWTEELIADFTPISKFNKLWCESTTNPAPYCDVSKFITFSVARWQHRTARRADGW